MLGGLGLRAAGLSMMAALVTACTVVVDDGPRPRPPYQPGPQACTREYVPVCGRNGPDTRTFANACLANASGYRVAYPGQCTNRPGPGGGGWGGPGGGSRPQACTRDYAPVCARQGSDSRTFGNACSARAEGYRVLYNGRC